MNYRKIAAVLLAAIHCSLAIPMATYAYENYSLGDPDGDGYVNVLDAAAILANSAALAVNQECSFTQQQFLAADTNKDGVLNATDAAPILVYSAFMGSAETKIDFVSFLDNQIETEYLDAPQIIVGKKKEGAIIKWEPDMYATGYEIYRYDGMSVGSNNYKLIDTITGDYISSYTDKYSNSSSPHCYKIRAFRTQANGTIYSEYSNTDVDYNRNSILNAAELESHGSFKVYNRQHEETTSYDYTLSEEDYAILDLFAAEHFPEGATREAQLWTTFYWIHTNVNYARTTEQWDSIAGKSWVEAIFVDRTGQCAQYNGAMTAMMAYLGYDVCLVRGWRGYVDGNYWQHFWPEVVIDGTTYIMECGNLGKSGDWYYFLETYDNTKKYICNGESMN